MGRLPNHNYYPKEWREKEPLILKDEDIALNPDRILGGDRGTPYAISPQIAEFTRKFGEELAEMPSVEELQKWQENWEDPYLSGKSFWVPENRWAHEVVTPPIHIQDNIYRLDLSADIYIKVNAARGILDGVMTDFDSYKFISRTLYTYIEKTEEIINLGEDHCPTIYTWHVRWLPRDEKKLTFFIDDKISDMLYCNVSDFVVDTTTLTEGYVSVPVTFRKGLKKKMPYMKHDTPYLYVKVEDL